MSHPAPNHARRLPLNLAAGDLRAVLDMEDATELRDLINDYRSRVNAQHQKLEEGKRLFYLNAHHPRAVNPEVETRKLKRLQSVLKYLINLHQLEPRV